MYAYAMYVCCRLLNSSYLFPFKFGMNIFMFIYVHISVHTYNLSLLISAILCAIPIDITTLSIAPFPPSPTREIKFHDYKIYIFSTIYVFTYGFA